MEHSKDYYLKIIRRGYQEECNDTSDFNKKISKEEFIGNYVFDICTYDDETCVKMTREWLEVCECISEGKTFEYISTDKGYETYLRTINYDFFMKKIDWGSSIRGAWWSGKYSPEDEDWEYKFEIDTCVFWNEDGQILRPIMDIRILTQAIREFIDGEDK